MRKQLAAIVVAVCVVAPVMADSRPLTIDLRRRVPISSAVRSAMLPGWGQAFNRQASKGYFMGASFGLCVLGACLLDAQASDTYTQYERRGARLDGLYDDYQSQASAAATLSYLAAGIWIYSVADAWFVMKRANAPSRKASRALILPFDVALGEDSISVTVRSHF